MRKFEHAHTHIMWKMPCEHGGRDGVKPLQDKSHRQEAERGWIRAPWSLRRNRPCGHLISDFRPQDCEHVSGEWFAQLWALNAAGSHGVHQGAPMILVFLRAWRLSRLGRNSPLGETGGPRGVATSKQVRPEESARHPLFYLHPKDTLLKSQFFKSSFLSLTLGTRITL